MICLHFVTLLLFFANPLLATTSNVEFDIQSDSKKWKLVYEGAVDNFSIVEYTTDNETLTNWTRLASVVTYDGLSASPSDLFMKMLQGMQSKFPECKISYRIHSQAEGDLMGEWHLKGGTQTAEEHNWIKIISADEQIHTLLFTTKNPAEVETVRPKWEKILQKSHLKNKISTAR